MCARGGVESAMCRMGRRHRRGVCVHVRGGEGECDVASCGC